MKRILISLGFFLLSSQVAADTLYQANVGGYSTGVGIGLGPSISTGYVPYSVQTNAGVYGGYSTGFAGPGYDSFNNYPYSSGCCGGCNFCNNCDTSYSNRCR